MDKELQKQLFIRFPWTEYKDSKTGHGAGHSVYFACGEGWFQLIWNMLEEIEQHYKQNNADINTLIIIDIKEKYGGLRFYVSNVIHDTHDIILKYESKSETICDICGEQGRLHEKNGWIRVLCSKCAEEEGYKGLGRWIKKSIY